MDKKEEKKFKLSKDNATAEFGSIVEEFNFNISTDMKERIVTMNLNGIDMKTSQEFVEADSYIQKIMSGKIYFDEDKKQIVCKCDCVEFRFGKFTRSMQKATKVKLNRCSFATMDDEEQDSILMAMTGISDPDILGKLSISDFNDLRMIAGYFFN